MRLSRAERSLLVDWWFTVDRVLLATILVIVGAGLLLSLAASPSIALKRGLPTFHFVQRHFVFAVLSVVLLLAVSLLSQAQVRRLSLAVLLRRLGADGDRARWRAPRSTARGDGCTSAAIRCNPPSSPSRPSSFSRAWLIAESERRPDMPAIAAGGRALPRVRRPARAAARCRPDAAREPGVVRAVPAGRPAAALVAGDGGGARAACCSRPT